GRGKTAGVTVLKSAGDVGPHVAHQVEDVKVELGNARQVAHPRGVLLYVDDDGGAGHVAQSSGPHDVAGSDGSESAAEVRRVGDEGVAEGLEGGEGDIASEQDVHV